MGACFLREQMRILGWTNNWPEAPGAIANGHFSRVRLDPKSTPGLLARSDRCHNQSETFAGSAPQ
jgi:hypothetical protein